MALTILALDKLDQLAQRATIMGLTVETEVLKEDIHMEDMVDMAATTVANLVITDMATVDMADMVMVKECLDIQVTGEVHTQAMVALATLVVTIQDSSLAIKKLPLMDASMLFHQCDYMGLQVLQAEKPEDEE